MKKNNEALYEVKVFDEGQSYVWFTDTLENIIDRLNDGVEIGAEWVYPGLDKCETAEELNDELNNKLNLSWFSIQVTKIEFVIVEEYRNGTYQNSYIMAEELEQVIKDRGPEKGFTSKIQDGHISSHRHRH